MKKLVFFIGILILSLGCSSELEVEVKDIPATASSVKSDQSSGSQEKLHVTPTADKLELAAICSFDASVPKISCQASGTTANGPQLRWESNASGWSTGKSYEFKLIEPHQLVSPVYVTLEECRGSRCKTVEVSLDTSSIVPESSKDDSKTNNDEEQKKTVEILPTATPVSVEYIHPGLEGCEEKDSVLFTHHAADLNSVSGIYPGIVTSGNWLKPNSYVWIDQDTPIYAPSDATNVGLLRWIQYYQDASGVREERLQFNIQLQLSCDIRIIFGHVEELVEPFKTLAPTVAAINSTHIGYYTFTPMEIKAGTLLGYAREQNLSGAADGFDFVMSNSKKVNQFANQDRYLIQGDLENLLRAECPFDYYPTPMRKEWSSQFGYKDKRPIGYDCDMSPDRIGTIAGGWFQTPHDPDTDGKTIIDWGLSIRIKSDGNLNIGHPNGTLKVYPNDPTFKDPKTVVDASCFYDSSSNNFGFLKPIGDIEMEVAFGNGYCPSEMPANSETFYR